LINYNNILQLPERCLLNKRLTKAFFLKNFGLSPAEKKLLNNVIQSMEWLASVKTANANIPSFIDSNYNYEEIQVMICTLPVNQLDSYGKNCVELFQKHIPYQMLVIVEDETDFIINASDKRINQNDKSKRTIEAYFTSVQLSKLYKNELNNSFYEVIKFTAVDKANMESLYKSYINALVQLRTASVTGSFNKRTQKRTEQDMVNLFKIEAIEKEIVSLSVQLKKESPLNNKVNLNVEIQNKRKLIVTLKSKLD
jgi:hypothetical protein